MSGFVMTRPNRTSLRTFPNEAFILNTKSFCRTSPTLTFPLSSIVENRSHCCDVLTTCPSVLIQKFYSNMHGFYFLVPFFVTRVQGMRIVVTSDIVYDMLRLPRVEYPDYPGCDRLKTMSKDKLISVFCECPSDWGEHQFTYCLGFAKGPHFLNMVMTFVLHLLSHYNSITKPRAWFLLSLLKHLSIDFLFHFILFIIDVHRDTVTHDKLIFPSAITRILCHFSVPFPLSNHFSIMGAIDATTIKQSKAQFRSKWPGLAAPPTPSAPYTSTPFSSTSGVTFEDIMA